MQVADARRAPAPSGCSGWPRPPTEAPPSPSRIRARPAAATCRSGRGSSRRRRRARARAGRNRRSADGRPGRTAASPSCCGARSPRRRARAAAGCRGRAPAPRAAARRPRRCRPPSRTRCRRAPGGRCRRSRRCPAARGATARSRPTWMRGSASIATASVMRSWKSKTSASAPSKLRAQSCAPGRAVDELRGDPQPLARPPHAAFEQVADPELARDLPDVDCCAPCRRRTSCARRR